MSDESNKPQRPGAERYMTGFQEFARKIDLSQEIVERCESDSYGFRLFPNNYTTIFKGRYAGIIERQDVGELATPFHNESFRTGVLSIPKERPYYTTLQDDLDDSRLYLGLHPPNDVYPAITQDFWTLSVDAICNTSTGSFTRISSKVDDGLTNWVGNIERHLRENDFFFTKVLPRFPSRGQAEVSNVTLQEGTSKMEYSRAANTRKLLEKIPELIVAKNYQQILAILKKQDTIDLLLRARAMLTFENFPWDMDPIYGNSVFCEASTTFLSDLTRVVDGRFPSLVAFTGIRSLADSMNSWRISGGAPIYGSGMIDFDGQDYRVICSRDNNGPGDLQLKNANVKVDLLNYTAKLRRPSEFFATSTILTDSMAMMPSRDRVEFIDKLIDELERGGDVELEGVERTSFLFEMGADTTVHSTVSSDGGFNPLREPGAGVLGDKFKTLADSLESDDQTPLRQKMHRLAYEQEFLKHEAGVSRVGTDFDDGTILHSKFTNHTSYR